MTREQLFEQILKKKSYLCVGLDTDPKKLPQHLLDTEDPVFEFNRQIIEATADLCVAYKPNIAFYEAQGPAGWVSLEKTLQVIPGDIFTIADAKRGDIGNTAELYARAFFETLNFDSVTVAPYMGADSVKPFLQPDKWVILLALTSNTGSQDFQMLRLEDGNEEYLFEQVLRTSADWGPADQMMYVVGATQADYVQRVRDIVPNHFLLVPGVGAQGGSLEDISRIGMNKQCGLLVNSSRGIIYASSGPDFAEKAREAALAMQREMEQYLDQYLG
ncbi:orotidine-5'-phosphate decarboxylase [Pontibacter ummariensis]|uniref:Orotidine 5'-phosphate decarboxylase n=1 Tax=Pontibacter ummariensis TaxID=1610492 RepID=A0A239EFY8_9BACT|nr:orotidine-5'-phosphate decarboxylase [Pontibacter ummariensis]PRY13245.1 orotidine-5'-phosphate decarboxylase [Pontibacter ummariensis]SNS43670.1 orotidine-5'-phosphate decarboxylase [Pontibacter ummariensis]